MKRLILALPAAALVVAAMLAPAPTGERASAQTGTPPAFSDGAAVTYTLASGASGASTAIAIGTPAFSASTVSGASHSCAISTAKDNASNDPARFKTTGTNRTGFAVSVSGATCVLTYTGTGVTNVDKTLDAVSIALTVSDGRNAAGNAADTSADDTLNVTVKLTGGPTADHEALDAFYGNLGGGAWDPAANWRSGDSSALAWGTTAKTFNLTAGVAQGRTGYSPLALFPPHTAIGSLRSGTSEDLTPGGVNQNFRGLWRNTNGSLQWWDNGAQRPRSLYDGKAIRIGGSSGTVFAFSAASTTTDADIGRGFSWATSPANIIPSSGNWSFEFGTASTVVTQGAMSGTWTGITLTSGRVSAISLPDRKVQGLIANVASTLAPLAGSLKTLDLSTTKIYASGGNRLTGGAANLGALGALTGLTSLDLSGHNEDLSGSQGLGTPAGSQLPGGLRSITALTFLDLRDTGICINPGAQPQEEAWLNAIRARSGGQALIATCGSPAAPAFAVTATDTTGELESGASGATTPIRVGSFDFSESDYSGATEACTIVSAKDNPAAAPGSFLTTGTDRTGFTASVGSRTVTVAGTPPTTRTQRSCDITYTGTGITWANTLRAVSIVVGLGDGVNAEGGADTSSDATVRLTVELSGLGTDEAALHALFNDAGGTSWTAGAAAGTGSWREEPVLHTFQLTAGSNATFRGYVSPSLGSIRNSSGSVRLGSNTYTIAALYQSIVSQNTVLEVTGTPARATSDWDGLRLRVGTVTRAEDSTNNLSTRLSIRFPFPGNTIPGSGNFDAVLLGSAALRLAELETSSTWHGVTITNDRVTTLNLSNNNLSGAVPATLGNMIELTSLDLSDNSGLTATTTVLRALATGLTKLTSLDLSGTGICVDPGNAQHAPVVTWIGNIRAKNTNTGVAKVPTCGSPVAPAIAVGAVTYELASGADGSSTAIAIGAPAFTAGDPFIGGANVCAIASARGVGSNDPADFATTGGTDLSASFAVTLTGSTCAITYTGAASVSAARDQTLEAVSLAVTVTDGVDPAAGTISAAADDTIRVTVKFIEGEPTDRDALDAFYAAGVGSGWSPGANWLGAEIATITLTAGQGGGRTGRSAAALYPDFPQLGSGSASVTVGGVSANIYGLWRDSNGNVEIWDHQQTRGPGDWASHVLDFGTTQLAFRDAAHREESDIGMRVHRWTGTPADIIPASGSFTVRVLTPTAVSSTWTGVTVASNRVTALELPNRGVTGAGASVLGALDDLTALATLDLSGNAGLTGSVPAALLAVNTLTNLDLSGTGVCVDPSTETAAETWITAIRGRNSGAGVAKVATCGTPAAPSFSAASARAGLEAGASGTGTAIAIATPTFAQGTYVGGGTATCTIESAKQNASYDPADFTTTGTDVTGFTIDGATCALTYTGGGLMSSAAQLAVSIAVGISDGVDPAAGTLSSAADDTIQVTVKLVGLATDREALLALYGSAGGTGWTTSTGGWAGEALYHTIQLTAGSGTVTSALGTGNGYQRVGTGSGAIGSLRGGRDITVRGLGPYQVNRLVQLANGNVVFTENQGGQPASRWADLNLRLGTTTLAFTDATTTTDSYRHWTWAAQASGLIPSSGNFDALIIQSNPALAGTWHGATVSGTPTRLTALALPDNNLSGTLPALLADLSALTSLDLSGNTGLTGRIPATIGSLAALTSLDLSDGGWSGAIPTELGSLTALTTLDLSGNAGLTAPRATLETLATGLTNLTSLDLSGTGICLTRGAANEMDIRTWIAGIRAQPSGVARVDTCGASADPAFTIGEAVTYELASEADGSTTAIAIGTPAFTQGAHWDSGAAVCAISTARSHGSNDPADFITTGGTDVSSSFAIDGATCAITYTGGGLTSADTTLEAVSIAVTLTDGVDPEAGTTSTDADATLNVTVKLTDGQATDRDAIDAFYAATGGASWTAKSGWDGPRTLHTWTLTGGSSGGVTGFRDAAVASPWIGSRQGDPDFRAGPAGHKLRALMRGSDARFEFYTNQYLQQLSQAPWDSWELRMNPGGTLRFADRAFQCSSCGPANSFFAFVWNNQPADVVPSSGSFTASIVEFNPPIASSWTGVTLTSSRVSALELPNNNLAGALAAALEPLDALSSLTTLDLSDNSLTGTIPGAALDDHTGLTSLNLSGNSLTGTIPTQLGALTSLTTLDLSGNAALGGNLAGLTGLTSLTTLDLTGTRLCVNPATDTAVESWLNTLRMAGASVAVITCGSPSAPAFTADAATWLLDVGANGSSTPVALGAPTFRGGSYSGGTDACSLGTAIQTSDAASFLTSGTAVPGFVVGSSDCAVTWTGSSAPTRVVGTRVAVSLALELRDGVNATGGVDTTTADDTMQVTVRLVDLASDKLAIEALYDDTNGAASWTANANWKTSTLTGSWTGVTLTSGRLTALALPNNGLNGRLPALMGDLSRLTSLDLSRNPGLTGGIPAEWARLRNVTNVDLRGTRVCARNIGGEANDWLNGIRAKPGGSVRLGFCPSASPLGASTGIVVVEEGAPSGLRYSLQLTCGSSSITISLAAGERYAASVSSDAACSLTATDRQGASEVRGLFSGRSLGGGDVVVTFVREDEDDDEDEMEETAGPNPELERTLVTGTTYALWRAPEAPVADAVEELTLCVIAVYWWDALNQRWESWFPGGERLGVNTLESFTRNAIYVFTTEERTADNCGLLPEDVGGDAG